MSTVTEDYIPALEFGHVRILPIDCLKPSPENAKLYRPVVPTDPEVIALAKRIEIDGVLEPIVISTDGYILSGHRRHCAAGLAGLEEVPVRFADVDHDSDLDEFTRLLREYNRQRLKSNDELLREALVETSPDDAYQSLLAHRRNKSAVSTASMDMGAVKKRAGISAAKQPMLEAVLRVIEGLREFLPVSDRKIHYELLNDPPLRHASKPESTYRNVIQDYKDLTDLLTRARVVGTIPSGTIADETRGMFTWHVHRTVHTCIRDAIDGFLTGYWRDLMQSQPNHVEIIGEKNTLGGILKPVAMEYCIPLSTGRGYCSLPPREEVRDRYLKSGKDKLILLMVTDFDPDGEVIARSYARCMRDDFDLEVHPIKVGLTAEQVKTYKLVPRMKAKETSVHYEKFVEQNGDDVFEVEALRPKQLQKILRDAIDSVIDRKAFNKELDAEKQDAHFLAGVRQRALSALAGVVEGGVA
jgi:ParB-like chromosome segregation protein Spo0J